MRKSRWFVSVVMLMLVTFACGVGGGGSAASADTGSGYDTKFPMPTSVTNFTAAPDDQVNFQTSLSVKDTIAFYRSSFAKAVLKERTINTAITDTTFSMVFDGDPSGQAIVVQGVDLGNGTTNVNIRYERL
jgi:ABC-type glycerol-3-phosphate transport system substrate-binding protein